MHLKPPTLFSLLTLLSLGTPNIGISTVNAELISIPIHQRHNVLHQRQHQQQRQSDSYKLIDANIAINKLAAGNVNNKDLTRGGLVGGGDVEVEVGVEKRDEGHENRLAKRDYSGHGTFYAAGQGACGFTPDSPSDHIVALNIVQWGGGGYPGPNCGRWVTITGPNGAKAGARVTDQCPGCGFGDLDMSEGLFQIFASFDAGRIPISWVFNDETPEPSPTSSPWTSSTWSSAWSDPSPWTSQTSWSDSSSQAPQPPPSSSSQPPPPPSSSSPTPEPTPSPSPSSSQVWSSSSWSSMVSSSSSWSQSSSSSSSSSAQSTSSSASSAASSGITTTSASHNSSSSSVSPSLSLQIVATPSAGSGENGSNHSGGEGGNYQGGGGHENLLALGGITVQMGHLVVQAAQNAK